MGLETLHQRLTNLLLDKGCAVTKPSIDALLEFIAIRDQSIIDKVIRDAENSLEHLQRETRASNE